MKFKIKHEIRGRIRLQSCQKKLSCEQADALQYYLSLKEPVESVKVLEMLSSGTPENGKISSG